MKYDYLIVGAGLYGAVYAQRKTAQGKRCLVIDKRIHIAGNIYSEEMEGIQVHKYGPHIFHTDREEVWEYMQQFARFHHFVYAPLANYKGELYNLPFNMNTFSKLWGIHTPQEAKRILARQIKEAGIENPRNLEEQALALVGRDIYEKFIRGYTQKQWGMPCTELPAFIIRRIPVRFTFDNNYFNHPYQGIPDGGYTKMVENMLQGVEVRLETDYLKEKAALNHLAERIVYTGPIDAWFDYCYGALSYRSLRFETEIMDQENFQGTAAVNYTDAEIPYTRIVEHKHFEPANGGRKTVITKEYPADWQASDEPYYPIENEQNRLLYQKYAVLADKEKNVRFGGRLGRYQYLDMDQVVWHALRDSAIDDAGQEGKRL